MVAGSRQQYLWHIELLFQQGLALLRKWPIAGNMPIRNGLSNVVEFLSEGDRTVERNI